MTESYKNLIAHKTNNDIWHMAKQNEYKSLDSILLSLENLKTLTWRNAIALRMLGLIVKPQGGTNLEVALSSAGETLISSKEKQKILDEQLLKIYFASYVNSRSRIDMFPMAVIYRILQDCEYISFEEYRTFVCWINTENEVEETINLIKKYRSASESEKSQLKTVFNDKISELGYVDFNDHIDRLFNIFTLSSFLTVDGSRQANSDTLVANSNKDVYESLLQSIKKVNLNEYEDEHSKVLGLIQTKPEHTDITQEIDSLSTSEQRLVKAQIQERNKLPNIEDVTPKAIGADFIPVKEKSGSPKKEPGAKKIDYEERGKRNRLVGSYGETLVIKFEQARLIKEGKEKLASQIEHCSLTDDSLGYDVKSFETDGREKHIEVKTVTGKPKTVNFFISSNELEKVENDEFHTIYLVFDYESTTPSVLEINNLSTLVADKLAVITPVNYRITINVDYRAGAE